MGKSRADGEGKRAQRMRADAEAQATERSGDLIGVMAGARRERWDGKRLCRANTKVTESLKESSRTLSDLILSRTVVVAPLLCAVF